MLIKHQSALISGVFASAFSWYNITPQPDIVRGLWYSGLVLSLLSITIAMQQSVALYRLGSNREGLIKLQALLSYKVSGAAKPRYLQIYVWQTPVMLLNVSILLFLIGLLTLVYHEVVDKSENVMVSTGPMSPLNASAETF
jgi:hypothetical protein